MSKVSDNVRGSTVHDVHAAVRFLTAHQLDRSGVFWDAR
jgi:hypothetical protein